MTQRKCGTCRFYQAGAQHGSCTNPANPNRDAVALLRPTELGCRAGWGKDYWVDANLPYAPEAVARSYTQETEQTQPIRTVAAAPPTAAPPPAASAGVVPLLQLAQEDGVKRTPPMKDHPELNDEGIPIRNLGKRSSVAEAHRRALARRDKERKTKEERDQQLLAMRQQPPSPTPAPSPPAPVTTPITATLPPDRNPLAQQDLTALPTQPDRPAFKLPLQVEPLPVPVIEDRPKVMRRAQVFDDSPQQPEATVMPEAVDRVISAREERARPEPQAPAAIPEAPAVQQPSRIAAIPPQKLSNDARSLPDPVAEKPAGSTEPAAQPSRYWHELPTSGSYTRMPLPEVSPEAREVNEIGRQRPGAPAGEGQRMIRTMEQSQREQRVQAAAIAEAATVSAVTTTTQPAVTMSPAVVAPQPEAQPRQIDEALLQRLETGWWNQERAEHPEQRCGTCRYFRQGSGEQGSCGCSFAGVQSQSLTPGSLGCLTGLGSWWAATDEGWLERTERRPRRATPLLDTLLREYDEQRREVTPERRRAR